MKKYLLIASLLVLVTPTFATHLIGGDITYKRLPHNVKGFVKFEITLTVFVDDDISLATLDDKSYLGIYNKGKKDLVKALYIAQTEKVVFNKNLCENTNQEILYGKYVTDVVLPKNPNGYLLTYERCCRGTSVNVQLTSTEPDQPFYFVTEIPNTDIINTSPVIQQYIKLYCNVNSDRWSLSYYDVEGDSIVIRLQQLIKGNSTIGQTQSKPEPGEDYIEPKQIEFNAGFNYLAPFGIAYKTKIEDNRLIVSESASQVKPGRYFVSFEVMEYRKGVLLGSRNVDAIAFVFYCNRTIASNTPVNLNIDKSEYLKPRLSWQGCAQLVKYYEIFRSDLDSNDFYVIDQVSASTSRYIDSSLATHGKYYYRIKGEPLDSNKSGESNIALANYFPLSINGQRFGSSVVIYPNPTNGILNIKSQSKIIGIEIYDLLGNELVDLTYETKVLTSTTKLDFKPGLYVCKVATERGLVVIKFWMT